MITSGTKLTRFDQLGFLFIFAHVLSISISYQSKKVTGPAPKNCRAFYFVYL